MKNEDLRKLHQEIYKMYPMRISYEHPNYFVRMIEQKRVKIVINEILKNADVFTSLLDIGCEECYMFNKLGYVNNKVGVDFLSEPLLKVNKKYYVVQGDTHNLPFRDKYFDIVVCSETLEHVYNPEIVLGEISRIGRDLVILSIPNDYIIQRIKKIAYTLNKKSIRGLKKSRTPVHVNLWNRKSFLKDIRKYFNVEKIISSPSRILEMKIIVFCRVIK